MSPPRWVLDTNVWVSAMLWQGLPGRLLELASEQQVQLFTSRVLRDELTTTLAKKKLIKPIAKTGLTAEQLLANFKRMTTTVTARQLEVRVSRDADDDAVLACALAARAALIVSGDDDLLVLKQFSNIPIVLPHQALRIIGAG